MDELRILLERYRLKLVAIDDLIKKTPDAPCQFPTAEACRMARLTAKASEYRTMIVELEKALKEEEIRMMAFMKQLVVTGCLRGSEGTPMRNYKIAIQLFKEHFGLDYEAVIDKEN